MRPIDHTIRRGILVDRAFSIIGWASLIFCLSMLGLLLYSLLSDGASRLSWDFLTSFPSRRAAAAGAKSALVGSLLVMLITACTAIPLGIAAGVYLEEYARKNWFTSLIEVNIANLAAVPSIIYGLMALGLLVYQFHLGQSILTGGITLAFLILPIVIVATREALRAIPQHMREAAFALGASRWQVVRDHLLPYSTGGIATGVIIALSRAVGETAPLVTIGAISYIAFLPPVPFSERPWLPATNAQRAVARAAQADPLPAGLGTGVSPLRAGTIEVRVRPSDGGGAAVSTTLAFDPSMSIEDLRAAFDSVPGLAASLTPSGYLALAADSGSEFRLAGDTAGLTRALGLNEGGGLHGPVEWAWSPFTVLPIQMFNWLSTPDEAFAKNAAAAGLLLMAVTLGMNGAAIFVRARMRRRIKW
ncbi:MAG: phosphate ABC transporter permease PstA [Phycisphaerales bacterium]|nr:phosphate ABC transporter permease PstA [Phycisphaerales bacterium]